MWAMNFKIDSLLFQCSVHHYVIYCDLEIMTKLENNSVSTSTAAKGHDHYKLHSLTAFSKIMPTMAKTTHIAMLFKMVRCKFYYII